LGKFQQTKINLTGVVNMGAVKREDYMHSLMVLSAVTLIARERLNIPAQQHLGQAIARLDKIMDHTEYETQGYEVEELLQNAEVMAEPSREEIKDAFRMLVIAAETLQDNTLSIAGLITIGIAYRGLELMDYNFTDEEGNYMLNLDKEEEENE
jgi:hypothetical protein